MKLMNALKVAYQLGRWRFAFAIAGILLVFLWLAWAIVENGGPLCGGGTSATCTHGKITP
jgi:hypothetical protein